MSLISCPECKQSVSTEAFACPSCGFPLKPQPASRKTGLWWGLGCLLAVPAVFMVIAVIGLLAAIAIPSFVRARDASQTRACISNMQLIDSAKNRAAAELDLKPGDAISAEQISNFMEEDFGSLACPGGGEYSINSIGSDPECSVHGSLSNPTEKSARSRRTDHGPRTIKRTMPLNLPPQDQHTGDDTKLQ